MSVMKIQKVIYDLLDPGDDRGHISSAVNTLIISMVVSTVVMLALETEHQFATQHEILFARFEFVAVVFFTFEYGLRLWSVPAGQQFQNRWLYFISRDSVIDLVALVPLLVSFLTQELELRYFLLLRLFQLLKLFRYFAPLSIMATVFKAEFRAFMSAMMVMLILIFISATGIYLFENDAQPEAFSSIPVSMWWAIVTLTTLGYGDIVPVTTGGKIFAGVMTVFAVGVVSLPAGMLASRFSEELRKRKQTFALLMDEVLADGHIDKAELKKLEKIRQKLCLSESDVRAIQEQRNARTKTVENQQSKKCPKCGHIFD